LGRTDRWTPSTTSRWVEFNGQGATTGWVGWTDRHTQQGEVGLRSTLNETQGTGEDGQMDTINQPRWVGFNGLGWDRWMQSRQRAKVNSQGDPRD